MRLLDVIRHWLGVKPRWDKCVHASCWSGKNASRRMMNMLSPAMPEKVFRERVAWMLKRGCDTVHWFVANKGDGEYAGYCIYGAEWDWEPDKATIRLFRRRIAYARRRGLAVVLWLMADDSSAWAKAAAADFPRYVRDIEDAGLLRDASTVVAGLEADEYWSGAQVADAIAAVRAVYKGKVGVHHTSGRTRDARLADILFFQVVPGLSDAQIRAAVQAARATGKPVNMFEMERSEDRAKSVAALGAGAFGVGNW